MIELIVSLQLIGTSHIFLDDLAPKRKDGFPDYTDPSLFPALWQQPLGCEKTTADRV